MTEPYRYVAAAGKTAKTAQVNVSVRLGRMPRIVRTRLDMVLITATWGGPSNKPVPNNPFPAAVT
jgi:hypothetical protein